MIPIFVHMGHCVKNTTIREISYILMKYMYVKPTKTKIRIYFNYSEFLFEVMDLILICCCLVRNIYVRCLLIKQQHF